MADTLVDEPPLPPSPTLRDVSPAPPPGTSARGRALVVGIAILTAVLLVGAVAFYLFVWRYEPVARRHIPGNATVVVRFELADLLLSKPVRDNLWPLLILPSEGRGGKSRNERIREETGVDLSTDVRELVVASTDPTSWVMLLGGHIPRDRFVPGLARVAQQEGWVGFHEQGEMLVGPGGVAVGQADDGTVILGTSVAIVAASLPATGEHKRIGLPEGAPVTFAITKRAWHGAASVTELLDVNLLSHVERATGRFTLGDAPQATMTIEPAAGVDPKHLAGEVDQALTALRLITLVLPDALGEKSALQAARATVSGEHVVLSAAWPADGLDRACGRLAALIRVADGR